MSDIETMLLLCMIFLFLGMVYGVALLIAMVVSLTVNWLSSKPQENK